MKVKDKMNKQYTLISIYVIITCIIIYCLSIVAKDAPGILNAIMDKLNWILRVMKPILLAFVFAYLTEPLVNFFEDHFNRWKIFKRVQNCRTYAVVTTLLLILIGITALVSMLVYSVTDQVRFANFDDIAVIANEYVKTVNDFYNQILDKLSSLNIQSTELNAYIKDASTFLLDGLKGFANSILASISNISGYLTTTIFALIIGIYFLLDGAMIKNYISRVSTALLSKKVNRHIRQFIKDADIVFSGYLKGQLTDVLVMMILISAALSIIGVKFGIVIGVLAGLGNLIPYFGPFVAYAGTILICLINGDYKRLIIGVIALFIIQTIDGNIIGPKLLSKSIKIHPLLVIIFLIFGSAVGGFLGMILAVPVGALVKVLFVRFIDHRMELKEKEEDLCEELHEKVERNGRNRREEKPVTKENRKDQNVKNQKEILRTSSVKKQ
ncbi:AI-2E family transporter [Anaerosporobacter faecicola]|uniref:AI-2E family transporter n=1 Tax=Anaerosporobacter faecicola TaxID=2718714 RepID=UPI00143AD7D8|nr:AI-2E family transporter [Anaerosporobacter faecicola]